MAERAALQQSIAGAIEKLRACYRAEMAQDPKLEERMALVVYVMPEGKVADMSLLNAVEQSDADEPSSPSLLSDAMAQCLGAEVMRWKFPPSQWSGEVQYIHPPIFIARWWPKPAAPAEERRAIAAEIHRHSPEFRDCYEEYLRRAPPKKPEVRIVVEFKIIPKDGTVEGAVVAERSPPDARLESCVLDVLGKLTFAVDEHRGKVSITYPFRFEPVR